MEKMRMYNKKAAEVIRRAGVIRLLEACIMEDEEDFQCGLGSSIFREYGDDMIREELEYIRQLKAELRALPHKELKVG